MEQQQTFGSSGHLDHWEHLIRPALHPYNVSASVSRKLDKCDNVPPAAEGTLRSVAISLQKGAIGMSSWGIADLTLGLYKLARRHIREGSADTINGCVVTSIEELGEICHWLQWGLAAYSKDTQDLADTLKVKKYHIVRHVTKSAILKPAFFIAVDNLRKCVVMSIRGTLAAADVLTDLNHHSEKIDGGYAHSGMLAAARHFHDNEGFLLRDLLAANQGYRLVLVGHSLGAGTAALLCMILHGTIMAEKHRILTSELTRSKIICWGFGCPPCVDKRLAEKTSYIRNVVLQDDIVPRICPAALEELRSEILETDWNQAFDDGSKTMRMMNLVQSTCSSLGKVEPALGLEKGYVYDRAKKYGHAAIVAAQKGIVSSLVKAQHGGHGTVVQKAASVISLKVPVSNSVLFTSPDSTNGNAYPAGLPLERAEATKNVLQMRRLIVPGILYHIIRKPLEHGDSQYSLSTNIQLSETFVMKDDDKIEIKKINFMVETNQLGLKNEVRKGGSDLVVQHMVVRNDDPSSSFNRVILSGTMLTDHSLYHYHSGIVDSIQWISAGTAAGCT